MDPTNTPEPRPLTLDDIFRYVINRYGHYRSPFSDVSLKKRILADITAGRLFRALKAAGINTEAPMGLFKDALTHREAVQKNVLAAATEHAALSESKLNDALNAPIKTPKGRVIDVNDLGAVDTVIDWFEAQQPAAAPAQEQKQP